MTTRELAEKYLEVFGVPTRTNHKDYLRKRVAWKIQEIAEGGLSARALAKIDELAALSPLPWNRPVGAAEAAPADAAPETASPARDLRLPPAGTVLKRAHGGVQHEVTVLEKGFEYGGERFRSLSAVARKITGTAWNGFAFFNLAAVAATRTPEA
jgi:hypothetical protein